MCPWRKSCHRRTASTVLAISRLCARQAVVAGAMRLKQHPDPGNPPNAASSHHLPALIEALRPAVSSADFIALLSWPRQRSPRVRAVVPPCRGAVTAARLLALIGASDRTREWGYGSILVHHAPKISRPRTGSQRMPTDLRGDHAAVKIKVLLGLAEARESQQGEWSCPRSESNRHAFKGGGF